MNPLTNLHVPSFLQLATSTKAALFHPTWDVMLMFFIVAAVFLYAVSTGRGRIILILFATYISYGIASFLFSHKQIYGFPVPEGSIPHIIIFGSLFVMALLFLFKAQVGSLIRSGMRDLSWLSSILLSIMESGLITSFMYTLLSPAETKLLSPTTLHLVGSPEAQFLWVIAPFVWLIFINYMTME